MFSFVAGKCNRTFRRLLASVTSKFVNRLINSCSYSVFYLHSLHLQNDFNVELWQKWSWSEFKKLWIYCRSLEGIEDSRVRAVIELGTYLIRARFLAAWHCPLERVSNVHEWNTGVLGTREVHRPFDAVGIEGPLNPMCNAFHSVHTNLLATQRQRSDSHSGI